MKDLLIMNGPNLNLLGKREPEVYGSANFEEILGQIKADMGELLLPYRLHYFQSNHEGALLDQLHAVGFDYLGIVFNPGAYAHTSIALADAVRGISRPVVEVHLSNVHQREEYRRHSYLAEAAVGVISGLGWRGYALGLRYLIEQFGQKI
ncbi:type II 3-dehydroquinate dehydratase [Saprospira grandis]|nr:type II 3-dehydroquinate dehydratase [Saprospira grandis]